LGFTFAFAATVIGSLPVVLIPPAYRVPPPELPFGAPFLPGGTYRPNAAAHVEKVKAVARIKEMTYLDLRFMISYDVVHRYKYTSYV
jgi:hypothetical protein